MQFLQERRQESFDLALKERGAHHMGSTGALATIIMITSSPQQKQQQQRWRR